MEPVAKRKRTPTKVVEAMDISTIRPYFTVPLSKASKELGISENCLKKVCRRVGIARWPYREIADVQRTIQRIEQSSESQEEDDERTSALLSGLKLQEHLLLTRGKSEQPPAAAEPPTKMAKREVNALPRSGYGYAALAEVKERMLASILPQCHVEDSGSKLSASPEVYSRDIQSAKFTDGSTQSSSSSPHTHDFSYSWQNAMPWLHAQDAMHAAHFYGHAPQLSPTAGRTIALDTNFAGGHHPNLPYQHHPYWAAQAQAHAHAQWYAAERLMRMAYY